MKNIYHAEMALLIRREKEIEKELDELRESYQTWKERVELARKSDRNELAQRASGRIDELRLEAGELRNELKSIITQKKKLRKESRRPSGQEVKRAEALLESFRQSGLVDPEEAQLESDLKDADLDGQLDELRRKATDGHVAETSSSDSPPSTTNSSSKEQPSNKEPSSKTNGSEKKSLDDLDIEDLESLDADELEKLISDDTDGDL